MRDDPRENLKWLEQELLASERPAAPGGITDDTADLLAQVDHLLEDLPDPEPEPEPPAFAQKRRRLSKGERVERNHIRRQFDEDAAVLTKTKDQLRKESKKSKSNVNRNVSGLILLAGLEIMGIVYLLGWWLR